MRRLNINVSASTLASFAESKIVIQALVLQLARDNIQIVLHRYAVWGIQHSEWILSRNTFFVERVVVSALRTALAADHRAVIPICRSPHAAMHAGTCLFTCGVALSALYLAKFPLSRFDEQLSGLKAVIAFFSCFPWQRHHLATQSLQILLTLHDKCLRSEPDGHPGCRWVSQTTGNGEPDGVARLLQLTNSGALQS